MEYQAPTVRPLQPLPRVTRIAGLPVSEDWRVRKAEQDYNAKIYGSDRDYAAKVRDSDLDYRAKVYGIDRDYAKGLRVADIDGKYRLAGVLDTNRVKQYGIDRDYDAKIYGADRNYDWGVDVADITGRYRLAGVLDTNQTNLNREWVRGDFGLAKEQIAGEGRYQVANLQYGPGGSIDREGHRKYLTDVYESDARERAARHQADQELQAKRHTLRAQQAQQLLDHYTNLASSNQNLMATYAQMMTRR